MQAALTSPWPQPRKAYPKRTPKLDPFKRVLPADLDTPSKQRRMFRRIYARLIDEHAMTGIAYQTVRDYVGRARPQIRIEAARAPAQAFVPQTHKLGAEAEVDFGEVVIRLHGQLVTIYLFALRMSFSGKAVHALSFPADSRRFSKDTCTRSRGSACPTRKFATTTSTPRCLECSTSPAWGRPMHNDAPRTSCKVVRSLRARP